MSFFKTKTENGKAKQDQGIGTSERGKHIRNE
jgi:hypothetical protein